MITLDEAREIAYAWHGGGGSPLYSFASTSGHGVPQNIIPDTVREVDGNIPYARQQNALGIDLEPELQSLRSYLVANLPAPPEHKDDDDGDDDPYQLCGTHIYNVMMDNNHD